MIAVIAGSTGLVGNFLLLKLLSDADITQVISVSRRPLKLKHPKLKEVILGDLTQLEAHAPELKGELYFCCLGTTIKDAGTQENFKKIDLDAVVKFGEIAKQHEAQCLITISASGAKIDSYAFYSRVKGEAEDKLKLLQLKRLVIFQPGLLIGKRHSPRTLEELAIKFYRTVSGAMSESLKKKVATEIEHLAERMLEEAKKKTQGHYVIESINI